MEPLETPVVTPKASLKTRFFSWVKAKRSHLIIALLASFLLLGVSAFSAWAVREQLSKPLGCSGIACLGTKETPLPTAPASPSSTPSAPSWLDGAPIALGKESLEPLAVMIENHPDARPQYGLSSASVVYEAIAEGGITRFMALYRDPSESVRVGPIRSARTYFVDLATEYHAIYAHMGGNRDALDLLEGPGVYNMDGISIGESIFTRDYSRNVAFEHTTFAKTDALREYANKQGWPKNADFSPWLFQDALPATERGTVSSISIKVSDPLYAVNWEFDPATDSYTRSMAGKAHLDANGNQPIKVMNIITQTVERTPATTRIGEEGWAYTLSGSGKAKIFQNGKVIEATWKKSLGRTRYYDQQGSEIKLVPGHTWVHLTHKDSLINY